MASQSPVTPRAAPATPVTATSPPGPALAPGLQQLIHRGLLSRAQAEEVTAYAVEVHGAVTRGEMTSDQAETLGQMLGLRYQGLRATPRRLQ